MSLYNKYRPDSLDSIYGNEDIVEALESFTSDLKKCPHVFLFHGPYGCGKTTFGRIVANMVGCKGDDLVEINASEKRGIDDIREIITSSNYMPLEGDSKVYILDEAHMITKEAANALLKPLEDNLSHVFFVLCTTDPQKLLPTIRSRCQQFQVKPLSEKDLIMLLRKITKAEGGSVEKEVLQQIVESSLGHPRDAIQILEQVISVSEEKRMETAKKTTVEQSQAIELCRALLSPKPSWKGISGILNSIKEQEPESVRRMVMGYCQSILLSGKDDPRCGLIMEEFSEPTYNNGFSQIVYASYSVIKNI